MPKIECTPDWFYYWGKHNEPWADCVAAVERLPALHYSVDFNSLSFGIMGFIVELWNY